MSLTGSAPDHLWVTSEVPYSHVIDAVCCRAAPNAMNMNICRRIDLIELPPPGDSLPAAASTADYSSAAVAATAADAALSSVAAAPYAAA